MIIELLLIILIVMSFGLLIYSHIGFMKAIREADEAMREADEAMREADKVIDDD